MSKRSKSSPNFNAASFERHLIDRVLLSIIDKNSDYGDTSTASSKRDRIKRLDAAKQALFGERSPSGDKEFDDNAALRIIAREYHRDKSIETMRMVNPESKFLPTRGPRSIRKLAEAAADGDENIADRLRKKFAARKKYYLDMYEFEDGASMALEEEAFKHVIAALNRIGIRCAA